ncbi:flagellar FlbD family protein [Botrimarina hoheduenensis]|uniref:Flagellar protein (FlbD) n=1 Tax=Botrimarina hoheduenensis TaxID=2528000 RepID=A0A5C5VZH1_9BACT|nr:flagellar FlbD family protein [Botrimarina hoheduenensis]TWT43189.1 Flagellar protein (FlbD) [Botrimarina hoheduenensis]
MIRLNRLDGESFLLNAELIKYVESRPDTFITLTTGDRIVVSQPPDEVLRLTLEYHQTKSLLPPAARRPTQPEPHA